MTSIVNLIKLRAILENLHTWAMRVLRPWISSYIDQWRAKHPGKDEASSNPPEGRADDTLALTLMEPRSASPGDDPDTDEDENGATIRRILQKENQKLMDQFERVLRESLESRNRNQPSRPLTRSVAVQTTTEDQSMQNLRSRVENMLAKTPPVSTQVHNRMPRSFHSGTSPSASGSGGVDSRSGPAQSMPRNAEPILTLPTRGNLVKYSPGSLLSAQPPTGTLDASSGDRNVPQTSGAFQTCPVSIFGAMRPESSTSSFNTHTSNASTSPEASLESGSLPRGRSYAGKSGLWRDGSEPLSQLKFKAPSALHPEPRGDSTGPSSAHGTGFLHTADAYLAAPSFNASQKALSGRRDMIGNLPTRRTSLLQKEQDPPATLNPKTSFTPSPGSAGLPIDLTTEETGVSHGGSGEPLPQLGYAAPVRTPPELVTAELGSCPGSPFPEKSTFSREEYAPIHASTSNDSPAPSPEPTNPISLDQHGLDKDEAPLGPSIVATPSKSITELIKETHDLLERLKNKHAPPLPRGSSENSTPSLSPKSVPSDPPTKETKSPHGEDEPISRLNHKAPPNPTLGQQGSAGGPPVQQNGSSSKEVASLPVFDPSMPSFGFDPKFDSRSLHGPFARGKANSRRRKMRPRLSSAAHRWLNSPEPKGSASGSPPPEGTPSTPPRFLDSDSGLEDFRHWLRNHADSFQ